MKIRTSSMPTTTHRPSTKLRIGRLSTLTTALVLAGCAVSPQALNVTDALQAGLADQQALQAANQTPVQRITLEEAMARALLHNRERRVQMMESAMASGQLAVSRFDMLPQLAANAGYTKRDKLAASSSGVLENGQISRSNPPTYSVSADKQSATQNLALSWNVLDFGLSYLRANQAADRLLIAKERERKAVHNLIQDVRTAYWRTVSAQKLLQQTGQLRQRVQQALVDSRRIESLRLKNPMEALSYQRDLLDVRRSLEALHKDLLDAKTTLGTLMGLPPTMAFEVVALQDQDYAVPSLKADMRTLERTALALRPELMELRYQKRITETEGRAALFGLLPGLNLNAGQYKDTNDFLLYNNWTSYGATLGLNLFNVLKAPALKDLSDAQSKLAQERRMALTAAVLGQVHLSRISLENAKEQFETSFDYLQVVRKIREQVRQMRTAERSGELELIREEMAEMLADLRRDVAYAELQNSYGRIFVSAGLDPLPATPTAVDMTSLASAMKSKLADWDKGEVGVVLKPLAEQASAWQGPGEHSFRVASDTFSFGGEVRYNAKLVNDQALPSWLKFDAKTQTFSGNPPASQASYAIELTAVDSAGAKVSDRFELKLSDVNDAPQSASAQKIAVTEGSAKMSGKLEAVDPDGDPLTYALTGWQKPAPGFTFQPDGQWQFDPSHPHWKPLKAGAKRNVNMSFRASDPQGMTTTLSLNIEVTGVNNPPEVEPMPEVKLNNNAKVVEGVIKARDADDDAKLSFEVLDNRSPEGFALKAQGQWTFDPQHPAYQGLRTGESRTFFVPIKVSDEAGGVTVARLQMTVTGTQP